MIIAVASGKGGTGKTMVTAALSSVWPGPVTAVDLDVEEPNLHLFLRPKISGRFLAEMVVPLADESRCTRCGACSELCQFKAISLLGQVLLIFPEMCHGCGGCLAVCPEGALTAGSRELGEVSWGQAGRMGFLMGRLRIGEAMSPPLMRAVKKRLAEMQESTPADVIIDCPPGVSCPAVNAVMDSDVILLVTEPTPFGFYDFKLAWEAFSPLGKPLAAVINRAGLGERSVYAFCREKGLPILAEIPYDRALAEAYSRGEVVAEVSAGLRKTFQDLARQIRALAAKKNAPAREAAHA
jgi:MinD superfamily P-loop ATPase